jgi:hypothetical protein
MTANEVNTTGEENKKQAAKLLAVKDRFPATPTVQARVFFSKRKLDGK